MTIWLSHEDSNRQQDGNRRVLNQPRRYRHANKQTRAARPRPSVYGMRVT